MDDLTLSCVDRTFRDHLFAAMHDRAQVELSALELDRLTLGFRRELAQRLSCFRPPDPLDAGTAEKAALAICKAFARARTALINRYDPDAVTRRFVDDVKNALQPRLF